MKKFAVVILNYNGQKFLELFLPKVIDRSPSADIWVVDNASNDGSKAYLSSLQGIHTVFYDENWGFTGGYNRAVPLIKNEWLILLNSDVEPTENWLISIEKRILQSDQIAAIQPKILSFSQPEYFEYAGACGGMIDLLGYPFCRGRIFNSLEKDNGQYDEAQEIFWATGACMAIKKSVFLQLKGFDDRFFAHMEEIDLCWRIHLAGYSVWVEPKSVVLHVGGGTLHHSSPFKTYLNFRNNLMMLAKNDRINSLIWKIPIRLILDWLAGLVFAYQSGFRHSLAVLRAHVHFLLKLPILLFKRTETPKLNSPSKIILFQYYFLNKKTYHQIFNKNEPFS